MRKGFTYYDMNGGRYHCYVGIVQRQVSWVSGMTEQKCCSLLQLFTEITQATRILAKIIEEMPN